MATSLSEAIPAVSGATAFDGSGSHLALSAADSVSSGALLGTQPWLDAKRAADQGAAATVPFVMAFGALGIVMSVITVSSVISGAVGIGLRRIGILKAIGFTPREVVCAYVAQALIPAVVGIALGVVLGNLLAVPLLSDTESVYGGVSLSVARWVDIAVPAAALVIVALAALIPALRAGGLHTVEAITVGRAPRTGRGQWARRAMGMLPLPRPVTYGLATPFTHPVRTLAMLLAVAFGTVAATFAVGLTSSLNAIGTSQDPENRAAVTVTTAKAIVGESFDTSGSQLEIHADMADFKSAGPSTFLVETKSGVSADDYAQKVAAVVQPLGGDATTGSESGLDGIILVMAAMAGLLTLMLITVAGLGVLNSVVLDTRERIHDLGVCKAIGMTPRQIMSLVLASMAVIGVIGGLIGVPAGYGLHHVVMPLMGRAVGTSLPSPVLDVYEPVQLLPAGRGRDRGAGRAAAGRLGGRSAYGHGAAQRVASGGARAAGADRSGPPGSHLQLDRPPRPGPCPARRVRRRRPGGDAAERF
ncbi:FtsX-like permease family protein [Streptomyces sp. NBC_01685]|uniref:ABC transporter permease n=1 Tax=Streptomyces sp. NBC_01685 TaxID=2975910 RepID=UPI003FCE4EF9